MTLSIKTKSNLRWTKQQEKTDAKQNKETKINTEK